MGSFKANGREQGSREHRNIKHARRRGLLNLEWLLEERVLLSNVWHPTSTILADVENGPMANLGGQTISLYEAFQGGQTSSSALATQFPLDQFKGDSVLMGLTAYTDFQAFETSLVNMGMQIVDTNPSDGLVDGWLPINELPAAAQLPQTLSGQPDYKPEVEGAAINEADYSTFANVVSQPPPTGLGLTGAGVTVGVISDSFNNLGGYAADVASGDLPPNVNILAEGTGGEDEGRAMAQNIYHIAPGAGLAFATGFGTTQQFANNVEALANTAGAKIIVDDVSTLDDPYFQPGLISQAIDQVTSQGVTYFSAAANEADHGYLSNFRAGTGTITGLPTGTFMNFNPSGGTDLLLPIQVNVASTMNPTEIGFQFDQPWQTQEPMGDTAAPTSQVNFYILDANGNIIASGTNNNVATHEPQQIVQLTSTGNYFVAIDVVSGPNPGHVEFSQFTQYSTNDVIVSQQFGSAGGTYYPTSTGHNSQADTIGVGAVPWWSPQPYLNQTPLASEPYSSFGPSIQVFDASGTALSSPVTTQNPTVTAPDGGNTTFFGIVADTANPPVPGQPATPTNLYATFTPDQENLPSFFGTSSAAPNTAAIAALMLQRVPTATPAQIKAALIESAATTPMNNSVPGTWNEQGGFGLINAVKAVNAIDVLRVLSTDPFNGETVTVTPSAITVTFTKPVNFSTVSSGDLQFTMEPAGVTVNVGTPVAVDNPEFPTVIAFPFSFSYKNPPTATANGTYSFIVTNANPAAPVMSEDGKDLVPSGTPITFTLADTTAPEVANTSVFTRTVTVQFTKAMNPSTITLANVYVERQRLASEGGNGTWTNPINLNSDPRTTLTYNPLTDTATLDYSGLPQTEMPSDDYRIVVKSGPTGVTDLVGNELDGAFSGSFPSGNGTAGSDFVEDLGFKTLVAPIITTFQMTAATDTGIPGDQNTNLSQPQFIGQVYNSFPGTVANLQVYVEFSGLHGGNLDLAPGGSPPNNIGVVGNYDVQTTTNSAGTFMVLPPSLPEGFQYAKIVVVGQPDSPPLPGLSSSQEHAFRIDKTPPQITSASFAPQGSPLPLPQQNGSPTPVSQLQTLSLYAIDNSQPQFDDSNPSNPTNYLATPAKVLFPAIDPATAVNVSNYSLILNAGTPNAVDESSFITSATFHNSQTDPTSTDPGLKPIFDSTGQFIVAYQGRIDLTFASGLPAGIYTFIAHTAGDGNAPGLLDAAGNPLDDTGLPGEPPTLPSVNPKNFYLQFNLQSQPVFITNLQMQNAGVTIGGPRSYYELGSTVPASQASPTSPTTPPTSWAIDLSNALPFVSAGYYNNKVQLIGSANTFGGTADGNFGDLGEGGLGSTDPASGFNIVPTTVTLQYQDSSGNWVNADATHPGTRLLMSLTSGTLPADYYQVYIPNQLEPGNIDTRINDVYGNQLDGEFLGNPTANGSYQDLLNTGVIRNGMSGDGVAGGAFMTGFVVVPQGHIIYARPDYVEDPLLPSTAPDGSLAKPYSALAPEGDPNAPSQQYPGQLASYNPNHDPNGGLNSSQFFLSGFNPQYDRNGNGVFDRSALYAASQLAFTGPVVVIALPGTPQLNPITGVVSQQTFVLQAPSGSDATINNASASVPFDTTLVFTAGSTLKLENASLFVQNQGSAIESLGGQGANVVNFTSYANDAVAGDTNHDGSNTTPAAGDWGGIVLRNFDQAVNTTQTFPVDGTLQGINGPAISGEIDDISIFNYTDISYAGGSVPATQGVAYSAIDLYNSRPAITNDVISSSGTKTGTISADAAIAADLDSFREDDMARGPLVRATTLQNNSLNGIWIRPQATGITQASDAMTYPVNPASLGGSINYTLDAPLPYILTSRLSLGIVQDVDTNNTFTAADRLYVQPGVMIKAAAGASIGIENPSASLNVGDRTYINEWDLNNNIGPILPNGLPDPNFKPPTVGDTGILFTSLYDDTATTYHTNADGSKTIYVPAIDSANGGASEPTPTKGSWGSLDIISGARAVINGAEFRYGGGFENYPGFSQQSSNVLNFRRAFNGSGGTPVFITNNTFDFNQDAPMAISPDGLLAGDPQRPLQSGHPFFRGNVLVNNDINGLAVLALVGNLVSSGETVNGGYAPDGPVESVFAANSKAYTLDVNSVWDTTDMVYVVRGSIILAGRGDSVDGSVVGQRPMPSATTYGQALTPAINLTIESALPGTVLANGEVIAKPGESAIVKFLNDPLNAGLQAPTLGDNVNGSTGASSAVDAGAGFIVGVDNGIDPPTAPELGSGMDSVIRFIGIPGNETTGQARVPVILTSLLDSSVPLTVRGVDQSQTYGDPARYAAVLDNRTTPDPGDGGLIYFGSASLMSYNFDDPRGGSIIYNTDIRYMTRVEVQGGGIPDVFNTNPGTGTGEDTTYDWSATSSDNPREQLLGTFSPLNQYNSAKSLAIIGSNFSYMSSAGVLAHPGPANGQARNVGTSTINPGSTTNLGLPGQVFRTTLAGEPVDLYLYNNTFSNMPVGVRMNSDTGDDNTAQNNYTLTLLNNTFYNVVAAVHTVAPNWDGFFYSPFFQTTNVSNDASNVEWIAMNNIFDGSTTAIEFDGQQYNTMSQYNLFYNNTTNVLNNQGPSLGYGGTTGSILGNPEFRNPAAGDFRLMPNSAAIDAARSEIGPTFIGNEVQPIETQSLTDSGTGGTRTTTSRLGFTSYFFGPLTPQDNVTLPGSPLDLFYDQWVPVLATTPNSYNGTGYLPGTPNFQPISGVRDQNGYLRVDDPNSPNVGFGSDPFYDVGAFEYRILNPPEVDAVSAITNAASPSGSQTIPWYSTTTLVGANLTPEEIDVKFNQLIDPNSISSLTVLLVGSGGDGIFGNGNDVSINLSGKLSFNNATDTLVIKLAEAGLVLPTDKYRLTLLGNGSQVLTNPQGVALDGENTVNDSPDGAELPLPSGDGFPGGNFYDNFIINTTPPIVTPSTFMLAPASDTNIVGDFVTMTTLPSFVGTITEPNATLVPLAGQTAILDIGIAEVVGGTTTVYYADSTNIPANLKQYVRDDAGTALTGANGNFTVKVGVDGAGTGLVTKTTPLLTSPYNVGSSGILANMLNPLPGTVSGYYVARVHVTDQSGNVSNAATAPFVVDTVPPVVTVASPADNSVINPTGPVTFVVDASQNLDLTNFTTTQIQLLESAPDGSFATGTTAIQINPTTITVDYLDKGIGGPGAETLSFTTTAALTNGLYQLTLIGTGSNSIRDIAGNTPASGNIVATFAVFNPNHITGVFVGQASFITDPTQNPGTRANPFPTITDALTAKTTAVGDRIEVLPGVYTENVTLVPFVSIVSADPSSTDSSYVPGNALNTVIRAPAVASGTSNVTVTATNLSSLVNSSTGQVFETEVGGFTIASPLVGDPALGPINPNGVGLYADNSDLLIDRDYFVDAGCGIQVNTSGASSQAPQIENDAIIGNINGVEVQDGGDSNAATTTEIINNTFAYNTTGLTADNSAGTGSKQAYVANNIFWQNHDQTLARNGLGIYSQTVNKLVLNNNMFSGNGASDTSTAFAAVNIGNGFSTTLLGPTAADAEADLGNFTGYPAFVAPRDPRPGSDGPAVFFLEANFGLLSTSAAINNALESIDGRQVATKTDLLGNPENPNPTTAGFHLPGYGPRDVGAFEYEPPGTTDPTAVGGAFRVVTTSLVPNGGAQAAGSTLHVSPAPTSIIVDFSQAVAESTVQATDLLLSGSDISSLSPVKATSVTWINNHTARFNLTGKFNPIGTVNVSLVPGSIVSVSGQAVLPYADMVVLNTQQPTPTPTPTPTPVLPPPITPPPAPAPTAPTKKKPTAPVKKHKVVAAPKPKTTVHKTTKATPISRKPPTFPGKPAKKK